MAKVLSPPPKNTSALDDQSQSGFSHHWVRWFVNQVGSIVVPESANENLTGTADGTNKIFALTAAVPSPATSLMVFDNGVLQPSTAYYISGMQVIFYTAPLGGHILYAHYQH